MTLLFVAAFCCVVLALAMGPALRLFAPALARRA
jgi:hypothetical protein